MLQYIKANENCNYVQDPLKRLLPDLTVIKLMPEDCLNAQFIAVDNVHVKTVKDMCIE